MNIFRVDASFREEIRKHWGVLLLAFVCMLFAFSGPGFSVPFILKEMTSVFGWSREEAALIASFKYATGAVFSIIVGRFLDVFGIRPALIFTTLMGAIALTMFLWIDSLATYYLSGILMGLAGPGTIVALKSFLSRVFDKSQGTAIGIMMMGASAGSVVVPLAITVAISALGWRYGIASMSLGIWLVALPMLIFAFPTKSIDKDHVAPTAQASNAAFRAFFADGRFWILGIALFLSGLVDQAFIQHQPLIFKDLGLSNEMGALAVSAFGLLSFLMRPAIGNYFDAKSNVGVSVMYVLLSLASLLALLLTNPIMLILYIVLRAAGHSAVLLDTATLGKHTFGALNIGLLLGLFTAFVNAGFAVGPWLMGRLYDTSGSYNSAAIAFTFIGLMAAGLVLLVKPENWLLLRQTEVQTDPVQRIVSG
jgi:predicted MFS family arabinose efflux permease